MLRKNMQILITSGILLALSLGTIKPILAQNNTTSEIPDKPSYEKNIGNGMKVEVDSTGGGIRLENGIRVGVERIPTGEPRIEKRGDTTIVDTNPKDTGIGINVRF
jgi:hypothetical protein